MMSERNEQPLEDTSAEWWEKSLPFTGVVIEIPQPKAETPTHSEDMKVLPKGGDEGGGETG